MSITGILDTSVISSRDIVRSYCDFFGIDPSDDRDPRQQEALEIIGSLNLYGNGKVILLKGKRISEKAMVPINELTCAQDKITDQCACMVATEPDATNKTDVFCLFLPSEPLLAAMADKKLISPEEQVILQPLIRNSISTHIS